MNNSNQAVLTSLVVGSTSSSCCSVVCRSGDTGVRDSRPESPIREAHKHSYCRRPTVFLSARPPQAFVPPDLSWDPGSGVEGARRSAAFGAWGVSVFRTSASCSHKGLTWPSCWTCRVLFGIQGLRVQSRHVLPSYMPLHVGTSVSGSYTARWDPSVCLCFWSSYFTQGRSRRGQVVEARLLVSSD